MAGHIFPFISRSELGKSINTDEAAALGAVYQAAHLGKGFKVLTFGVKEANIYPLVVSFCVVFYCCAFAFEPCLEKIGFLPIRKQRRRSALQ